MRALPVLFVSISISLVAVIAWICCFSSDNHHFKKAKLDHPSKEFSAPLATPDQSIDLVQKWISSPSSSELASRSRLLHLDQQEAFMQIQKTLREQGTVKRYKWLGLDQTLAVTAEKVLVIFESGHYRIAYLVYEDHQWKVDLESFVGHHSQPWQSIIGQDSCEARIRVLIQSDVYYNGLFDDEEAWLCFKMIQPDHEENLYGYVKRDSDVGHMITEISHAKNNAPVILGISRKESMLKKQYEIKQVIANGWMEPRK